MTCVLLVEDDRAVREVTGEELRCRGYEIIEAGSAEEGLRLARKESPEVALLDLRLPDRPGEGLLEDLLELEEPPEVIVLTAHGTVDIAVQAMKVGAFDFIEKPCRLSELTATVAKAVETAKLRRENRSLRRLLGERGGEMPVSPGLSSDDFKRALEKIAASDLPVLVTGETGVGKEVTARWIHRASPRCQGPFLVTDCASLQPNLIESELFGHERGAFTGAHDARPGLVETARGGTLFLDEIGELDASLQSKLLRLLESGEFRRIGGRESRQSEVRFVAATHRDLEKAIVDGGFREDLYYRLNVLAVRVPSLRERRHEITPLARYFLERRAGHSLSFDASTLRLLQSYDWPGNVRELRNVVERMAVLAEGDDLLPNLLPPEIATPASGRGDGRSLDEIERRHILQVLGEVGGNKTKAARLLKISPATLYSKLKRYRDDSSESPDSRG